MSRSITSGTIATTRLSTTAVVHVVQPRLRAAGHDETVDLGFAAGCRWRRSEVTVSIARTAALVIGRRAGHCESPPVEELVPRVGDHLIFSAWLLVIRKHQRLVRDHVAAP